MGERSSRPSVYAHATHRAREAMRRSKLLEEWARVGRRREGRIAGVQRVEQHAERPDVAIGELARRRVRAPLQCTNTHARMHLATMPTPRMLSLDGTLI